MNPASPIDTDKTDAPLIALTNLCGGDLRKVMGAFFSFLHRRTDFYLVPSEADLKAGRAKMGFRQGDAEKLLLASFRQFPLRRLPDASTAPKPTQASAQPHPSSASTDDKTSNDETKLKKSITDTQPKPTRENKPRKESSTDTVRRTADGLQVPVGNGGSTDKYTWTQNLEECSVLITVPKNTRGKDLDVQLKATTVSVKLKGHPDALVEGTLSAKINPSESTWTLEGNVLIIVLDKHVKTFWSTILEGDDEIDTALVDSRRKIDTYDQATQAQIRKIIFDQNQARKGLSSSDEILGQAAPVDPETLPKGVEYINQAKLDKFHAEKDKAES